MYDGKIVGRIVMVSLAGNEQRWAWSFKRETNGYEMGESRTRDDAMAAFWRACHGSA